MVNNKLLTKKNPRFNRPRCIYFDAMPHKLRVLSAFTLILVIATSCANRELTHLAAPQSKPSVKLKVVKVTPETVTISLRNDTNQNIYASYAPPSQNNSTAFLSNSLEKNIDGREGFEPLEPAPHFGPLPLPISPGQEILFNPFFLPEEKGKYRVKIAYLDDAEIYKLVIDKSPNLTDDELQKVLPAWKSAWSDTFEVKK